MVECFSWCVVFIAVISGLGPEAKRAASLLISEAARLIYQ